MGLVQCLSGRCQGAHGIRNTTSMVGKEPELVCEGDRNEPDIVRLISIHGLSSGTILPERDWTLIQSGNAHGERSWAWEDVLRPRIIGRKWMDGWI